MLRRQNVSLSSYVGKILLTKNPVFMDKEYLSELTKIFKNMNDLNRIANLLKLNMKQLRIGRREIF